MNTMQTLERAARPHNLAGIFDRLFQDTVQNYVQVSTFLPRIDVAETAAAYELYLHAPGMNKEDFKIEIKDNKLTLSGERKFQKEENRTWHTLESTFGSFSRTYTLPDNATWEGATAEYNQGVLHIVIPKDEAKITSRVLDIK